eukprot:363717-Chlamydomonas_euryale.AAC.2
MRSTLAAFVKGFETTIAAHTPSRGNTIKMHKLTHVVDAIKRYGSLCHITSNFFQQSHRVTKQAYGGSSKCTGAAPAFEQESATHIRVRGTAMSDMAPEDVRSNKTAYLAAHGSGVTSAPQSEISMAWQAWEAVDPGIMHGKKRRRDGQAALDRLAQQPELEFLPHFLREWCHLRAGVSASNAHIPDTV